MRNSLHAPSAQALQRVVIKDNTNVVKQPNLVFSQEAEVPNAASGSSDLERAQDRADKLSEKNRDGKDFTRAGKDAVKDVNKAKNDGKMKCDNSKEDVQLASQHKQGEYSIGCIQRWRQWGI